MPLYTEKNCLYCNKTFLTIPAELKRGHGKYCSRKCRELNQKGKSMNINGKAEKNSAWRGNEVSYKGLHKWIGEQLGKPNICLHCNKTEGKFEWANKSHKYLRDLNDWIRLCPSCHSKYDKRSEKLKEVWQIRKNIIVLVAEHTPDISDLNI